MALNFTTPNRLAFEHGIKMLVYGKSGVGKTSLVATAPSPFLISAESGVLSIADREIPCVAVTTIDELNEAYDWCKAEGKAAGIKTICLDSITEIGEVVLAKAKATVKDPRQAYGELIEKMVALVKGFRDLPGFHVYLSAKQETVKDEVTGISSYGPSMPGSKLGPQLPYLFDEVFHLGIGVTEDKTTYRYLRTAPDLQYDAKDRSGALDAIEEPNLAKIIQKIQSHHVAP